MKSLSCACGSSVMLQDAQYAALAGKTFRCAKCGSTRIIPAAVSAPPTVQSPPVRLPTPAPQMRPVPPSYPVAAAPRSVANGTATNPSVLEQIGSGIQLVIIGCAMLTVGALSVVAFVNQQDPEWVASSSLPWIVAFGAASFFVSILIRARKKPAKPFDIGLALSFGIVAGNVGLFVAHYAPIFGSILERGLAQPFSPARWSIVPVHAFVFFWIGVAFSVLVSRKII